MYIQCYFFLNQALLLTIMVERSLKAVTENHDTPATEETLDFDDDTLRGEEKRLNVDLLA